MRFVADITLNLTFSHFPSFQSPEKAHKKMSILLDYFNGEIKFEKAFLSFQV